MKTAHGLAAITVAILLSSGCGHKKKRPVHVPPPPAAVHVGDTETGVASWYGNPYHGRQAASGEVYDMEAMVAAHRTLPFQTWVRVLNLSNRKTVEVRIIDRGPFIDGRIVDLSHAAARAIGLIGPGTARVRLEVVRAPAVAAPGFFAVQVGAFRNRDNAQRLRDELQSRYGSARLVERQGNPVLWRVLAGKESTEDGATRLAERIRREGSENNAAFVVRLDNP